MEEPEEYEHIPWSALTDDHRERRNRLAYATAGILVAATIGAVAARAVWKPEAAAESPGADVVLTVPTAEQRSLPPITSTTLPLPSLYSEADLMATLNGEKARIVAARAEWFVTDYFTTDRDRRGSTDVHDALPAGSDVPALPHDGESPAVTYVEWARATRVTELTPGRFRVAVAFRGVAESAQGGFDRLPVRAVDLMLTLGPDGGAAVVDLPTPAFLPNGPDLAPSDETSPDVAPAVAAAALAEAERWGKAAAEVIGASATQSGWRVVVGVSDASGNSWPMTVWLDPEGLSVPPGLGP